MAEIHVQPKKRRGSLLPWRLDANRLSVEGQGENNPAATNSTASGRQQNRRVQIVARNS